MNNGNGAVLRDLGVMMRLSEAASDGLWKGHGLERRLNYGCRTI